MATRSATRAPSRREQRSHANAKAPREIAAIRAFERRRSTAQQRRRAGRARTAQRSRSTRTSTRSGIRVGECRCPALKRGSASGVGLQLLCAPRDDRGARAAFGSARLFETFGRASSAATVPVAGQLRHHGGDSGAAGRPREARPARELKLGRELARQDAARPPTAPRLAHRLRPRWRPGGRGAGAREAGVGRRGRRRLIEAAARARAVRDQGSRAQPRTRRHVRAATGRARWRHADARACRDVAPRRRPAPLLLRRPPRALRRAGGHGRAPRHPQRPSRPRLLARREPSLVAAPPPRVLTAGVRGARRDGADADTSTRRRATARALCSTEHRRRRLGGARRPRRRGAASLTRRRKTHWRSYPPATCARASSSWCSSADLSRDERFTMRRSRRRWSTPSRRRDPARRLLRGGAERYSLCRGHRIGLIIW